MLFFQKAPFLMHPISFINTFLVNDTHTVKLQYRDDAMPKCAHTHINHILVSQTQHFPSGQVGGGNVYFYDQHCSIYYPVMPIHVCAVLLMWMMTAILQIWYNF